MVRDQASAIGAFDLFHDSGSVMSDVIRTHGGVYAYPAGASPDRAYAICTDYTGPKPSYNSYNPSMGAQVGATFCFKTSEGRLGWVTIEAVQPGDQAAVLSVRIWDRA